MNEVIGIAGLLIAAIFAFVVYVVRSGGPSEMLRRVTDLVNGAESAWMNLAASLIPYGVSLIPAYLTYQHVYNELDFDWWIAVDAGVVVELFGVVAMQTIIRFWQNNKKYTSEKSEMRAPLKAAVFAYGFYLVITLTVNVVLEIVAGERTFWPIVAIALFSLLGVPSGILVAIRTTHREILDQRLQAKTQGKPTQQQPPKQQRPKYASDFQQEITAMLQKEWDTNGRVMPPKEITAKLKLDHNASKGYVSQHTTKWMQQNGIQKDKKAPADKFTI